MIEFSKNLKMFREKAGLTKSDMAKKLGVSLSAYSFYENGRDKVGDREPNFNNLVKIAEILQVTVDTLLSVRPISDIERYKLLWLASGFKFEENGEGDVILEETLNAGINQLFDSVNKISPTACAAVTHLSKENFCKLSQKAMAEEGKVAIGVRERVGVKFFSNRFSRVLDDILINFLTSDKEETLSVPDFEEAAKKIEILNQQSNAN